MKKKLNMYLVVGAIMVALCVVLAVTSFVYTPFSPTENSYALRYHEPDKVHIMGCDKFGRDVFSRVLKGIGNTMGVGFCVIMISGIIGTILGAVTGYFGGIVDTVIMRFNDAINGFPSVLLALVFISVMGTGKLNVITVLSIVFIPSITRVVRGEFIKQRNMEYVKLARLLKINPVRIIFVHILPNVGNTLAGTFTIGFNNAILAESGLSYLGVGVMPPDASLGLMMSEYQGKLMSAPWCSMYPGLVIMIIIVGFTLLAEGIRREQHA
ncbi:MAG: ABC transporter permease [Lachnospiraceae bacterium]|nr:ABC transporter permease [Lachnospiraceae bacterium]